MNHNELINKIIETDSRGMVVDRQSTKEWVEVKIYNGSIADGFLVVYDEKNPEETARNLGFKLYSVYYNNEKGWGSSRLYLVKRAPIPLIPLTEADLML